LKFYVATSALRLGEMQMVRNLLTAAGHEISFDWTVFGDLSGKPPELLQAAAHAETVGILDADFLVVLLPGRRGTYAEVGMTSLMAVLAERGLLKPKPTFMHSFTGADFEGEAMNFYFHSQAHHITTPSLPDFVGQVIEAMA